MDLVFIEILLINFIVVDYEVKKAKERDQFLNVKLTRNAFKNYQEDG